MTSTSGKIHAEASSGAQAPCDITVVILTFNEARHIERAIASVRPIARDIVVVDSFSQDNTVALAEAAGARVLQNPFVNYAVQFQWALDNAGIATGWTMRLDADEYIEPDLAAEIRDRLERLPPDIVSVNFDLKRIFMGRWVRHGGIYPLRLLRLWRTGRGRIENRWMDEHIIVKGGRNVTFKGGFADANENDLTFFTTKHNAYATREAIDVLAKRYTLFKQADVDPDAVTSRQAAIKRFIKERIYNRMPLAMGPTLYFLYRYVLRLGFLDGRSGTIYHVLQGFWYRYLVASKVHEYERGMAECRSTEERLAVLSRLTGYDLSLL
jgi:glycosyltransferase involved in cell wall biosynthesis